MSRKRRNRNNRNKQKNIHEDSFKERGFTVQKKHEVIIFQYQPQHQ